MNGTQCNGNCQQIARHEKKDSHADLHFLSIAAVRAGYARLPYAL